MVKASGVRGRRVLCYEELSNPTKQSHLERQAKWIWDKSSAAVQIEDSSQCRLRFSPPLPRQSDNHYINQFEGKRIIYQDIHEDFFRGHSIGSRLDVYRWVRHYRTCHCGSVNILNRYRHIIIKVGSNRAFFPFYGHYTNRADTTITTTKMKEICRQNIGNPDLVGYRNELTSDITSI